ncbi:MAG: tRNA (guanosine(46)-N7)-methyltransferase TrmB [Bacteroidetes bacterium]|nr:tRNA (guanosine(46)-N7)-methyltransferase TrmB [Bacteroidota bacterium]
MRNKLARFEDNKNTQNVIEEGKDLFNNIKGKWKSEYFKNDNPIILEIGCGCGKYTYSLATMFPNKNFIGVDIKGARIWFGSQKCLNNNIYNVAFLRTRIEHLDNFFAEDEIDEIIITFPDPRPKKSEAKKRLTSPRFLDLYKHIIKRDGIVYLKTDDFNLFEYTLYVIKAYNFKPIIFTTDLYSSNIDSYHKDIKTDYEEKYIEQGAKIKYLSFTFF